MSPDRLKARRQRVSFLLVLVFLIVFGWGSFWQLFRRAPVEKHGGEGGRGPRIIWEPRHTEPREERGP